jgi:hypothetical protein
MRVVGGLRNVLPEPGQASPKFLIKLWLCIPDYIQFISVEMHVMESPSGGYIFQTTFRVFPNLHAAQNAIFWKRNSLCNGGYRILSRKHWQNRLGFSGVER